MILELYKVDFYESARGECFAQDFLDAIPEKAAAKCVRWLNKLKIHGPHLPRPYADLLRGRIRELRVVFASTQYRLLYFIAGKQIIITHGFVKKTAEVPEEELKRAERLMHEWEQSQS